MDTKIPKTKSTPTNKNTPHPLTFSEGYSSVTDMVRGTIGDQAAEEFEDFSDARQLMNCLTVLRCTKEVSQAELAIKMGCGQPKVSKMEASADVEVNFGDIIQYASSLDMGVHIAFSPHRGTGVNRIRFHVGCIKRELDALVKVAVDDPTTGEGVESFALDTLQRMISLIEDSLEKLPHRPQVLTAITVEAEDDRGQPLPTDSPKRVPRRANKKVGV